MHKERELLEQHRDEWDERMNTEQPRMKDEARQNNVNKLIRLSVCAENARKVDWIPRYGQ